VGGFVADGKIMQIMAELTLVAPAMA